MKHQISAFMDGELLDEETDQLLAALKRDDALFAEWTAFHVISDALKRQYVEPSALPGDFAQRMRERLQQEPAVFSPDRVTERRPRRFALSAAASVAAVATVAGITFYNETPTTENVARESSPLVRQVDDYLMAHQEFSPSTVMQGMAPYVRTVSVIRED